MTPTFTIMWDEIVAGRLPRFRVIKGIPTEGAARRRLARVRKDPRCASAVLVDSEWRRIDPPERPSQVELTEGGQ
jgi:hypothetical protein